MANMKKKVAVRKNKPKPEMLGTGGAAKAGKKIQSRAQRMRATLRRAGY